MPRAAPLGLNDPGEDAVTRIVHGGALHVSRKRSTTPHAHYAWKIHVGLDAPVWYEGKRRVLTPESGARMLVVPPGVPHATGAVGWSLALFVAPGRHGTGFRASATHGVALDGPGARRLVEACRRFADVPRSSTSELVAELCRLAKPWLAGEGAPDGRVGEALEHLRVDPDVALDAVARAAGVSLDRLSRLVSRDTGMRLRQHVLWSRLLSLLSSNETHPTLARAAAAHGFADHAHLTRSMRAFLGRAPSDFSAPPDALEHW